jgi:hypothetical protein
MLLVVGEVVRDRDDALESFISTGSKEAMLKADEESFA